MQRGTRDVLDALHQLDQEVVLIGAHRREADAAVAHHGRGDAVVAGRRELRVPGGLAVVVGVDVDEARRHGEAGGVERAFGGAGDLSDGGDPAVLDRDVAAGRRGAGAVDQSSVADHEVVGHRCILGVRRRCMQRRLPPPKVHDAEGDGCRAAWARSGGYWRRERYRRGRAGNRLQPMAVGAAQRAEGSSFGKPARSHLVVRARLTAEGAEDRESVFRFPTTVCARGNRWIDCDRDRPCANGGIAA